MATSHKHSQPRLRASCDGCFLAKVKCSKARPICSRCLTCGIECRYSPSSRAGKPKGSGSSKHNSPAPALPVTSSVNNDAMMYALHPGMTGLSGWTTPPTSIDGTMSRSQSVSSGMALMGIENGGATNVDTSMTGDVYGPTMPWTPPNEMPSTFAESPMTNSMPHGHNRSHSYDMGGGVMGWVEPSGPEMFSFNQVSTPASVASNYFPSPTATPNLRHSPPRSKSTPVNSVGGSCTCFTVCLQSLQALHSASSPTSPPFDLVLSLNRKAIEGCAAMLACPRCMSRSGTHTAAMLMATVIGTIISFYRNASQSYFDHGPSPIMGIPTITASSSPTASSTSAVTGLGVSLGAYTVNGEDSRWLELEILARELRKLEEVYASFREVCSELSDCPEVSKAVIGHLGHSLGSIMQVVAHRKGDMGFS